MARTILAPRYTRPTRDPGAIPHDFRIGPNGAYACFETSAACEVPGEDDMVMIIPGGRYSYDGDASEDADWLGEDMGHEQVWRATLAYEKMGDLDEDAGRRVVRWALQVLSALSTIHSHGIIQLRIASFESFWLREDLSLALAGFLSADFVNKSGEWVAGDDCNPDHFQPFTVQDESFSDRPSAKYDLLDWATFVYRLMTGYHPLKDRGQRNVVILQEIFRTKNFPELEDEKLGAFVTKCWSGEYEKADDVQRDVVAYLKEIGVETEGDDIVGFDPEPFIS
ncbi:hypothetical protein MBLNU459_g5305t1 [Dothideomycetes sp. NU459]